MGADQIFDWNQAAASTLDWWREAGVDVLVEDAPRDWLAKEKSVPAARAAETPVAAAAAIPDTLDAFLAWRAGADAPEAAWPGERIAASGPADSAVMILLDLPDRDDARAGQWLTGAAGTLFDRMLAAIGLARETVYMTAVATGRPPAGRVTADIEERLGEIAKAHVMLAAPKRLLVMGNAASRAILGTDVAQARGSLTPINHRIGQTSVVASFHPRFLIEKPAAKAEAWKDLQMLIGGLS